VWKVRGRAHGRPIPHSRETPPDRWRWNSTNAIAVVVLMQRLSWLLFLLLVLGISGCDHATKSMATTALPDGQVTSIITGWLSLERTHNTDTAFCLLSPLMSTGPRLLLLKFTATVGVLAVAWLALYRFTRATMVERCALGLLLGGALGNAIDRWRWGYVVDFIHLKHWPVFNVADVALCAGALLLWLSVQRQRVAQTLPNQVE